MVNLCALDKFEFYYLHLFEAESEEKKRQQLVLMNDV